MSAPTPVDAASTQQSTIPTPTPTPAHKVAICIPTMLNIDARWALNLPKVLGTAPPNSVFFAEWRYGIAETNLGP